MHIAPTDTTNVCFSTCSTSRWMASKVLGQHYRGGSTLRGVILLPNQTAYWHMYSHCNNGLWSSHSLNSTLWLVCLLHNLKPNPVNESPSTLWTMSPVQEGRQGFELTSLILLWSKLDLSMGETWRWLSLKLREAREDYEGGLGIRLCDTCATFRTRILHLIWRCILWQGQPHTRCNCLWVRRIWYLLDTNFPLWLGCSQASRAFLNVIGLFW